jgi:HEAT repeat protein
VVEKFALSKDEDLRSEAIAALEQLQAPESVKLIQSGLRKEKDERLEGNWLRALASCASADTKVASMLFKIAKKDKSSIVQAQAVVALGWLVPSEKRDELLSELLAGDLPRLREASAIAAGLSREESMRTLLESHQAQAKGDMKAAVDAALTVLKEGSLEPLGPLVIDSCEDDVPRERFFGRTRG